MNLKETLLAAEAKGVAVGHFNITEIATLKAIIAAAKELNVPVMIGTSEGEREFLGIKNAVALVRNAREEFGIPVFLNADHTHSVEKAKAAIDAGYDEILFDGGVMTLEENIKLTKEVVAHAKAKSPDILVEGELGNIGSGSVIRDEMPEGIDIKPENLTTPEQAKKFVDETGVDMLAPAIGNLHGLLAHAAKPRLDIARIKAIKEAVKIPLVLHGGSGTADDDFVNAIKAGITVVHINTELRKAWRQGMVEGLAADPKEVTPSKILGPVLLEVGHVTKERLKLFNGIK